MRKLHFTKEKKRFYCFASGEFMYHYDVVHPTERFTIYA